MNEMTLFDNERWFTTKEVCELCNATRQSFQTFKKEVGVKPILHRKRQDSTHAIEYSESVLKEFQAWLMKNQANQGRSSEVVKAGTENAVKQDIAITTIIQSGNIEAMKCLMEHYVAETQAVAEVQA